ncbi:hypothetical protein EFY87_19195 [Flexivirga caeni]|uniref:Uncharacterized protein n=1 Tax=Flexivirga caeni TaxID=2294115 RepID=A0A3M9LWP0_9MICO|nr:hypothetical protein EFY87_19195 [Flexivirga caeni]
MPLDVTDVVGGATPLLVDPDPVGAGATRTSTDVVAAVDAPSAWCPDPLLHPATPPTLTAATTAPITRLVRIIRPPWVTPGCSVIID